MSFSGTRGGLNPPSRHGRTATISQALLSDWRAIVTETDIRTCSLQCPLLVHCNVCFWPDSEVAESLDDFRYRGYCGLFVLTVRLSEFDPKPTSPARSLI
jgi:hypothetical protein